MKHIFKKKRTDQKAKSVSMSKKKLLKDLQASINEVVLAKKGKIELQSARDFLNTI